MFFSLAKVWSGTLISHFTTPESDLFLIALRIWAFVRVLWWSRGQLNLDVRNCWTCEFFFLNWHDWHSHISTRWYPWSWMYLELGLVSSKNFFIGFFLFSLISFPLVRWQPCHAHATSNRGTGKLFGKGRENHHWKSSISNSFFCIVHLVVYKNSRILSLPF